MVPVEVMCSLGKVAIQGDQPLCWGVSIETCPKAVGSEAYVHLVTFAAYDAVNEGCIFACKCFMERIWCLRHCGKKDMSSFGLRTNFTAFVSTPYHSGLYSSNGYGGYLACRRAVGSREGCLHQGSRKSGVLAEAELGRGRKDR